MTFGMKFGSWAWEFKRDLDLLKDARKNVAYGAISGAVELVQPELSGDLQTILAWVDEVRLDESRGRVIGVRANAYQHESEASRAYHSQW